MPTATGPEMVFGFTPTVLANRRPVSRTFDAGFSHWKSWQVFSFTEWEDLNVNAR
jgi:hypothetical protein